ncbi:hypothetical protein A0H81_03869 [Grifola frondosa]|uniref:Uncharacterized protein n=1 Tax=Grifola frondosa TaxID=5627 RepID=A0A1C7MKG2_GRIFR|nr:hypothetical protein A0H81_03869 [Grifola frondosa]
MSAGATSDDVASGLKRRPESAWRIGAGSDATGEGTPDLREAEFIKALRPACDAESSGVREKKLGVAS